MRNFRFYTLFLLILTIFSLTSCEPNEPVDIGVTNPNPNPNPGTAIPGVFKADFKGATWSASITQVVISSGAIEIGATNVKGETFGIQIEATKSGTYPANSNFLGYFPTVNSLDGYYGINEKNPNENTGSVTISSIDTAKKTISGTFNFKGYWSDDSVSNIAPIQFTNGVFKDLPYLSQLPTNDTFFAKVDGVEFVEDKIDYVQVSASGVPDYQSIVAGKTSGGSIGLKLLKSFTVGTYPVTGPFSDASLYCVINNVLYNGESGSITITSKTSKSISGSFKVVVKNFTSGLTKTISEGTFHVEY